MGRIGQRIPGVSVGYLAQQRSGQSVRKDFGITRAAREGHGGGADGCGKSSSRQQQSFLGRGELQEPAHDRQAGSTAIGSVTAKQSYTKQCPERSSIREQQQHRHLIDITAIIIRAATTTTDGVAENIVRNGRVRRGRQHGTRVGSKERQEEASTGTETSSWQARHSETATDGVI